MIETARHERDRRPPTSRWSDTFTTLLLAATVVALAAAALPALFRATGVLRTTTVEPKAPLALGDDDDPHRIRIDEAPAPQVGAAPRDDDELDPFAGLRVASVRRRVALVERPEPGAPTTGELATGDLVRIVQEDGDWALVVRMAREPVMGWTKTSDVAVR
jgi:hypothetical protein